MKTTIVVLALLIAGTVSASAEYGVGSNPSFGVGSNPSFGTGSNPGYGTGSNPSQPLREPLFSKRRDLRRRPLSDQSERDAVGQLRHSRQLQSLYRAGRNALAALLGCQGRSCSRR